MRCRAILLLLIALGLSLPGAAQEGWLPVTKEDLALKADPLNPGAAAMILYREIYADNPTFTETNYTRIKIFAEAGRKYADVEIPYAQGIVDIKNVKARSVAPDGTATLFTGKTFDKVISKSKWVKVQAKAFTLPDIRVGSIIEYQYTYAFAPMLLAPRWELQDELSIRRLKYLLRPYPRLALRWITVFLPPGVATKVDNEYRVILEMDDVPAIEKEDYMPPASTLTARVDFFYARSNKIPTPDEFWKEQGKSYYRDIEDFIGQRNTIEREALRVAPASDPPPVRLKKLYDRAQQVRNLSYEKERTEKEAAREKLQPAKNVEDVLKRNYGYRNSITCFFVALARAAGFEASVVPVSERHRYFFIEKLMVASQLSNEIAMVKLDGKDLYLDPATPFCPFGLLSWERTATQGILPGKDGGVFLTTPAPMSADSVTERKADFRLSANGDLEGKLEITYRGQVALQRRLEARDSDETARRKDLQKDIADCMPPGATVAIESMAGWDASDEPLRAVAAIKVPGYAVVTGRRLMLPRGFFQGAIGHPFRNADRIYPIYFEFPWAALDEITLTLPPGFALESVPNPALQQLPYAVFESSSERQGNTLKLRRKMSLDGYYFGTEEYSTLKSFFDRMRSADEEQLVLRAAPESMGTSPAS